MATLARRNGSVQLKVGSALNVGSGYLINVYPVGAQVVSASGATITVRAGHGMASGDKIIRSDGTFYSGTETVSSTDATHLYMTGGTWDSLAANDFLFTLKADGGIASPKYDASSVSIYNDMAGAGTAITNAQVTSSSAGVYTYFVAVASRLVWELIRNASGTVVDAVIDPFGVGA